MYCACVAARLACSCANFIGLCNKNAPNSYLNSIFHRVVPGAWIQVNAVRRAKPKPDAHSGLCVGCCQGGDIVTTNGDGGASIYGKAAFAVTGYARTARRYCSAYAETLLGASCLAPPCHLVLSLTHDWSTAHQTVRYHCFCTSSLSVAGESFADESFAYAHTGRYDLVDVYSLRSLQPQVSQSRTQ